MGKFTEKYDVNNQKIFEGDIITYRFSYSQKHVAGKVYFKNGFYYVDDNNKSGHLTLNYLINHDEMSVALFDKNQNKYTQNIN
jgi:hypothetical protein